MYARKLSRLSQRRNPRPQSALRSSRIKGPLQRKDEGERTRIPVGKLKHKRSAVSIKSRIKVLNSITPKRGRDKSYTVLNPVTPLEILEQFANTYVLANTNLDTNKLEKNTQNLFKSYTLVNPVNSSSILNTFANADIVEEEKLLELDNDSTDEKAHDVEEDEREKSMVAGNGDEIYPCVLDSNVSIVNPVRTLFSGNFNRNISEVGTSRRFKYTSDIDCRRTKRPTRIPVRMKNQNSWEEKNVIHLQFNCGCGVVERKSLIF